MSVCGTSKVRVDAPRDEALDTIAAEARGDQPRGKRPASDCAPIEVKVTLAPLVTAPAGMLRSAWRTTAFVVPCESVSAPLVTVFVSPLRVRRTSIGMTPAPAGTTICRHTALSPAFE